MSIYTILKEVQKRDKPFEVGIKLTLAGGFERNYTAKVDFSKQEEGQKAHRMAVKLLVEDFNESIGTLERKEAVDLALLYNIVTPLTSMVAVNNDNPKFSDQPMKDIGELQHVRDVMNQIIDRILDRGQSLGNGLSIFSLDQMFFGFVRTNSDPP